MPYYVVKANNVSDLFYSNSRLALASCVSACDKMLFFMSSIWAARCSCSACCLLPPPGPPWKRLSINHILSNSGGSLIDIVAADRLPDLLSGLCRPHLLHPPGAEGGQVVVGHGGQVLLRPGIEVSEGRQAPSLALRWSMSRTAKRCFHHNKTRVPTPHTDP